MGWQEYRSTRGSCHFHATGERHRDIQNVFEILRPAVRGWM